MWEVVPSGYLTFEKVFVWMVFWELNREDWVALADGLCDLVVRGSL
jgi:hypothetical protein